MGFKRGTLHPETGLKMTAVEYNELARKHGWDGIMEDWEAQMRDKLEAELRNKAYFHSFDQDGMHVSLVQGKGGEIDYRITLAKAGMDYLTTINNQTTEQ